MRLQLTDIVEISGKQKPPQREREKSSAKRKTVEVTVFFYFMSQ